MNFNYFLITFDFIVEFRDAKLKSVILNAKKRCEGEAARQPQMPATPIPKWSP